MSLLKWLSNGGWRNCLLIETGSYYEPKPASNSRSSHVNCDNGKQAPPCQVTLNSFRSIYYFMSVLPACMSMYHMSIWCPQRSEECQSPWVCVTGDCQSPCGYWESNPSPMQKQASLQDNLVSSIAKPSMKHIPFDAALGHTACRYPSLAPQLA